MSDTDYTDFINDKLSATTSVPYVSTIVSVMNMPEVETVAAEFTYNFYTIDETTNSDGVNIQDPNDPAAFLEKTYVSSQDRLVYDRGSTTAQVDGYFQTQASAFPRYVTVSWNQVTQEDLGNNPEADEDTIQTVAESLQDYMVYAESEENMSNANFLGVMLQNTQLWNYLSDILSGASTFDAMDDMLDMSHFNQVYDLDLTELGSTLSNPSDAASAALNVASGLWGQLGFDDNTSLSLLGVSELIQTAVSNYQTYGMDYDQIGSEGTAVSWDDMASSFASLDDVTVGASLNNILAYAMMTMGANNAGALFLETFISSISGTANISANAVSESSSTFTSLDFIHEINPLQIMINSDGEMITSTPDISTSLSDIGEYESIPMSVIGYLIEKTALDTSGNETVTQLVSPFGDGTTLIDSEIVYGYAYKYRVRTCVYAEVEVINRSILGSTEDQYMRAGVLLLSRASPGASVRCTDETPPPHPPNLDFVWNYSDETLTIVWEHPVVPQNDVKKFQLFRRATVDDSFSLLVEYDFDLSSDPWPESEIGLDIADVSVFDSQGRSTNYYDDTDFDKDSTFIYAVVSKDARNMTSNYSAQFEVSFNRYKNQISVTTVSQPRAPKPYPNFYLGGDTFQDTVTVSDYDHMRVYFDPDFLFLLSSTVAESDLESATSESSWVGTEADAEFLSVSTDSDTARPTYKINIVNTDFQQSKTIDITILDTENFLGDVAEAVSDLAGTLSSS